MYVCVYAFELVCITGRRLMLHPFNDVVIIIIIIIEKFNLSSGHQTITFNRLKLVTRYTCTYIPSYHYYHHHHYVLISPNKVATHIHVVVYAFGLVHSLLSHPFSKAPSKANVLTCCIPVHFFLLVICTAYYLSSLVVHEVGMATHKMTAL